MPKYELDSNKKMVPVRDDPLTGLPPDTGYQAGSKPENRIDTSQLDNSGKVRAPAPVIDNRDLDAGLLKATGLGMREGEIRAIAQIALENELSANAVKRIAVRYFIVHYRLGEINLKQAMVEPPPPKKRVDYSAIG
jgi:hypothetical protein